ncbi:retrovirus-related pol polyprotein from transposon TNT 1-94 [Tanacetum coccineum]
MFPEVHFKERFRISRKLFTSIVEEVTLHCAYFRENIDCTERQGISPLLKCTSAIRQLAYDTVPDALDEYLQMGEATSFVASHDLWIRHDLFGVSGVNNDINVIHQSPLLNDLKEGKAPEISFMAKSVTYPWGYYLVDGIYPECVTFVKSVSNLTDDDHKQIREGEERKICLGVDLEPDEWIKDSGCSKHMMGNRKLFLTYKAYNGGNIIFGSNLRGQIYDSKCKVIFSENDSEIVKDGKVIELLHMDLYGPSAVRSYGGNLYTLVIVDDYSRTDHGREFDNEVQFGEFVMPMVLHITSRLHALHNQMGW